MSAAAAKKQSNHRYAFLTKMACPLQPPGVDFQEAMAKASGATMMLFSSDNHYWLHL